jgi:hypothetical protein
LHNGHTERILIGVVTVPGSQIAPILSHQSETVSAQPCAIQRHWSTRTRFGYFAPATLCASYFLSSPSLVRIFIPFVFVSTNFLVPALRPEYPMASVRALTTTFTPSASCLKDYYRLNHTGTYTENSKILTYQYLSLGPASTSACLPAGFDSTSQYFSPGICPSGYSIACSFLATFSSNIVETQATCCPTSVPPPSLLVPAMAATSQPHPAQKLTVRIQTADIRAKKVLTGHGIQPKPVRWAPRHG